MKLLTKIPGFKISKSIPLRPSRILRWFFICVHLIVIILLLALVDALWMTLIACVLVIVSGWIVFQRYLRMSAIQSILIDDKGSLSVLRVSERIPISIGAGSIVTGYFVFLRIHCSASFAIRNKKLDLIILPDSTGEQEFWRLRQFLVLNKHQVGKADVN